MIFDNALNKPVQRDWVFAHNKCKKGLETLPFKNIFTHLLCYLASAATERENKVGKISPAV